LRISISRWRRLAGHAIALIGLLAGLEAHGQIGIFEGQADIGAVLHPGSAEYDKDTNRYTVSGSGENMWFAADDFHFVWKKFSSPDVTLTADISILGNGGDGHRKAVLMIRQSLDGDSAYVDAALHGDGLTSLQFRDARGAITREIESNVSGPSKLRIEKQGDFFYLWIAGENEDLRFAGGSARVEMHAPFYVGVGVCAHDKDAVQKVVFTGVVLDAGVAHPKVNYSTLETVLLSGDARTGYVSTSHLTSPGWTPDGHALTFERDGQRQEAPFTPLKTAAPVGAPLPTQTEGASASLPPSDEFNNVSPHLSPDGKFLLFLSYSKDLKSFPGETDVALRIMSLADKSVKTLARFVGGQGSLGMQPWSPDGRRITFISYQSQTSQ
jgi:hypothetical protein